VFDVHYFFKCQTSNNELSKTITQTWLLEKNRFVISQMQHTWNQDFKVNPGFGSGIYDNGRSISVSKCTTSFSA